MHLTGSSVSKYAIITPALTCCWHIQREKGRSHHLSVTCALGNIVQVLQQVGLLLLKELHTGRIQIRPHWLVCVEGPDVHLAYLQAWAGILDLCTVCR